MTLFCVSARDMDNDPEHDELQAFLSRRPRDVQSAKRKNSIYEVQQKLAVERYIRKRDKKKGKDDKLARESTMDVVSRLYEAFGKVDFKQ